MERHLFPLLNALKGTAVAALDPAGRFQVFAPALMQQFGLAEKPSDQCDLLRERPMYAEDGVTPLLVGDLPGSRALCGEVVENMLITLREEDGSLRYQRATAAPVFDFDRGSAIAGAVVLLHDVTDERVLAHREATLRNHLIDVINHQFRTPLTTALGHIELLEDMEVALPPDAARSLDRVVSATRKLAELTRAVSELVDLEAATHATYTDADLMHVLHPVLEAQRRRARDRDVTLAVDLPPRLNARADRSLVARAVGALVDNALTHAPAGSRVTVRHDVRLDTVALVVEDEGPGISGADRERLIEPFEVGPRPADDGSRRGLGLALAATVASAHGGRLELADNTPNGLRAALVLPREVPAVRPKPAPRTLRVVPPAAGAENASLLNAFPELTAMGTGALEVAVRSGRPHLLADVLAYASTRCLVVRGSRPSRDELRTFCTQLVSLCSESSGAQATTPLVDEAVRMVGRAPDERSAARGPARLGDAAADYLGFLLAGDRWGALQHVRDVLDRGVPLGVLLVDVLEAAQLEVGRLWELGELSVVQEHYCTAVTQRALADLYPVLFAGRRHGPTLAAAHAPSNLHDIGLKMVTDLLETDGWTTTNLGAALRTPQFLDLLESTSPDVLALSASMPDQVPELADLIRAVRQRPALGRVAVLVGGRPFLVDPELASLIGADATAVNARAAVALCRRLVERKRRG